MASSKPFVLILNSTPKEKKKKKKKKEIDKSNKIMSVLSVDLLVTRLYLAVGCVIGRW